MTLEQTLYWISGFLYQKDELKSYEIKIVQLMIDGLIKELPMNKAKMSEALQKRLVLARDLRPGTKVIIDGQVLIVESVESAKNNEIKVTWIDSMVYRFFGYDELVEISD